MSIIHTGLSSIDPQEPHGKHQPSGYKAKPSYTHKEKVEKFERIKMRNFINSSRLEGMEINESSDLSLDEAVKKYTVAGQSQDA